MQSTLPIIFLAFANEYRGRYLEELVNESNHLLEILGPNSSNNNPNGGEQVIYELIVRENVRIKDIYRYFKDPDIGPRICLFHYGGHADGYKLLLQGKDGANEVAHGGGLVSALSKLDGLKLVFLNGCSTQKMAQDLVERGVPAVIGTADSIADNIALNLSISFYQGLAKGLTLSGAWEWAKDEATTAVDTQQGYRGLYRPKADKVPDRFPWDIEFKNDATREVFEEWNLPKEAKQPLFGLPPLKKLRNLPESPFLFLQPYGPEHAELFFGRGRYIRDLFLRISTPASPPIILLYGESGAGKSSLLHAGLVPRLEAAKNPNTQEPLYQVVYRRREQELMLVGTLFSMLASLEEELKQVVGKEAKEEPPEEYPNLVKIQELERMARELEGEAKDYFLASIERFKAVQSFESGTDYQQNLYLLEGVEEGTGARLRQMWRNIEQESGRQIILILDQVEEIYTRPHDTIHEKSELEDLLRVLKVIFAPQDNETESVRGKIILGYREEFNAKIEARFKDFALSRSIVFLEQLNRDDIIEVFGSLEACEPNKHRYNISIENHLPTVITDDLLKGKETVAPGAPPVAPVLQLILKKLWEKAYKENSPNPQFTVDIYDEIQSPGGKQMEDFFHEGMAKVRTFYPQFVDSGLALDILRYHVSELGTSGRQHIREIKDRYRHIPEQYPDQPSDVIEQLVEELKKVFLLTDNGRDYTSLPHDTLAPIVTREYNRSDKLGQRSARILDTKRPDFIKASRQKATQKVRLDDNDLNVIEGGIPGMRMLMQEESELLQISRREREKRLRLRRIVIQAGIVIGLFVLVLTIAAASLSISMSKQLRKNVVARAHDESVLEKEKSTQDKTQAIKLASHAYLQSDAIRTDVVNNLYQLYRDEAGEDPETGNAEESPLVQYFSFDSQINSMDYHPSTGTLFSLKSGQIHFLPTNEYEAIILDQYWENTVKSNFSSDGEYIELHSHNFPLPYYLLAGRDLVTAPMLEIFIDGRDLEALFDEEAFFEEEVLDPGSETPNEEGATDFSMEEIVIDEEDIEVEDSPEDYGSYFEPIAYYDFFSGKFIDAYIGVSFSSEELLQEWEPFTGPFYYLDPSTQDTILLDLGKLSEIKLFNEFNNTFNLAQYSQALQYQFKGGTYGLETYEPIEPYLEKAGVSLRKTSMTNSEMNRLELWDPEDFYGQPVSVFEEDDELLFLQALDPDRFFTISSETVSMVNEATIKRSDGTVLAYLPHEEQIWEAAVSPENRYLLTMTRDSVKLWGLDGERIHAYYHPNTIQYHFSSNGERLMTVSESSIKVWQPGILPTTVIYACEKEEQIVCAQFHSDHRHLIIGVAPRPEKKASGKFGQFISFLKAVFTKKEAKILFWNTTSQKPDQTFNVPAGSIKDVTISSDGQFAVAITANRGIIIEKGNGETASKVHREITVKREEDNQQNDQIFLSPNHQFIIYQQFGERRFELYDLSGKMLNAYSIQSQYHQGFNGSLMTSDDRYLIAGKRKELLLWSPYDHQIRDWAYSFDLSKAEKEAYNIDTINDALPGVRNSKGWGVGVMLLSLIFILVYFSGNAVQLVQQKKFLILGLFLGGFLLTALSLNIIWTFLEGRKLLLYGLFWIALALAALNAQQFIRQKKYAYLGIIATIGVLLMVCARQFYHLENKNFIYVEKVYQNQLAEYREEVNEAYYADKEEFDNMAEWYLDRENPDDSELSQAEIEELLSYWGFTEPEYKYLEEWKYLTLGFLVLVGILLLIVFPLLRFHHFYQITQLKRAYNWLHIPVVYAGLGFWVTIYFLMESWYVTEYLAILMGISAIVLGIYLIRQIRLYIKDRRFTHLFVFGIAFFLTAPCGYTLAAGLSLVKGWGARGKGRFRKAFWYNSLAGFLITGGVFSLFSYADIWSLYDGEWMEFAINGSGFLLSTLLIIVYFTWIRSLRNRTLRRISSFLIWAILGVLLFFSLGLAYANPIAVIPITVFLALIYWGLNHQLRAFFARRAAGRLPWLNMAAILSLLFSCVIVLGLFFLSHQIVFEFLFESEEDEYYYDDEALVESAIEEEAFFPEPENSPVLDTLLPDQEDTLIPQASEEVEPLTAEPLPDLDPALDGLLNDLFSTDQAIRDEARRELDAFWKDDPALIPNLIQLNYEYPDMNEGIWNTLYLLEQLQDAQLQNQAEDLNPYLDWTLERQFGPSTVERIQNLQLRVGQ